MRVYIKIWCLFLAAAMLLTGMGLAINGAMSGQHKSRMLEQLESQLIMAKDILQEQLRHIDTQLLTLSVSKEPNLFALYSPVKDRGLIYEKSNVLYQQLQMLKQSYAYVEGTYLLFPTLARQITDCTRYAELDQAFYERITSASEGVYVQEDRLYLFYMLSTSLVNHSGSVVGAEVSLEGLRNYCLAGIMDQMEVGFFFQGEPIAGFCDIQPASDGAPGTWRQSEGGWLMHFPITLTAKGTAMVLNAFLPQTSLKQLGSAYTVWYAVLMLVMAIELVLFAWLLRQLVARPLKKLLDGFDAVAQGDTTVRIHHTAKDEFADIYHRFNGSVDKLDTLLVREYQAQMAAQQAEIKHLQAQIQPHFLYNAFYQMYRICRIEHCETAADFALLLSNYFEYITHTKSQDGMVTLKEELTHAKKYIQIQQFRFGDRLNAAADIPEELLSRRVPKLILQPVIENAVKYCIEMDAFCTLQLRIHATPKQGRILLTVQDNGSLMTDALLAKQQALLQTAHATNGISGLANIHLRLRMMHSGGGITLSRSEQGGLRVEMML